MSYDPTASGRSKELGTKMVAMVYAEAIKEEDPTKFVIHLAIVVMQNLMISCLANLFPRSDPRGEMLAIDLLRSAQLDLIMRWRGLAAEKPSSVIFDDGSVEAWDDAKHAGMDK